VLEEDLKYRERLYIYRQRRRIIPWQHAAEMGVSRQQYRLWDKGIEEGPPFPLQGLDPCEHYMALRLRAGMTRRQLCARLGVSYWHLTEMERGNRPIRRLIEFWGC